MNIEKVDFVFENCEVITLPISKIKYLYCGDIRETIYKGTTDNYANRVRTCHVFEVIVDADSDKCKGWIEEDKGFCERVQDNGDLTAVTIIYADGSDELIHIYWEGDSEYANAAQKTHWNHNGKVFHVTVNVDG